MAMAMVVIGRSPDDNGCRTILVFKVHELEP